MISAYSDHQQVDDVPDALDINLQKIPQTQRDSAENKKEGVKKAHKKMKSD